MSATREAPRGDADSGRPAPMRMPGPRGGGHMAGAGVPVEKALDFKGSGKRLLAMLRPERFWLAVVVVLSVASVTLAVLGPKVLGQSTNVILAGVVGKQLPAGVTLEQAEAGLRARGQNQLADFLSGVPGVVPGQGVDFHRLALVLLAVLAIYVGSAVFGYLQGLITTYVVQRTSYRLRADVEEKLGRLPLKYFDGRPRGEILSRVTNDIDNISQTLQQTMSQVINAVLTVVGVLVMMFWISPLLAVVALVAIPLSGVVAAMIAKRSQPQFVKQWRVTGQLNGHIEEMYTAHSLVKVFGQQESAIATFHAENDDLYDSSFRAQFISGIIQPAMMFIANLNYVAIAVVGGLRVASGAMTLGDVQAFIQYSRQLTMPISQVASMANLLQSGVASAERVFELLDAEEQVPDPVEPSRLEEVRGRVAFENVSFRYAPDVPLIEDLSLVAEPGQTIAIVGPTGAGKTTLVNLIMRFYEVNAGRITLDGVDTATMSRRDLRSEIGMVLQDTWLFDGSIEANIAYGGADPESVPHEAVVAAAEATYVDRFVRTLPAGYDTVVDEDGGTLSVGERQLVTIARAFLADPAILILDEATSSVDTRTEVLVQRAMSALRAGRTSFVIAHRLSTIRDAHTILVMEDGAIVEQGSHEELLAAGGAYARLYASQFESAAVEV